MQSLPFSNMFRFAVYFLLFSCGYSSLKAELAEAFTVPETPAGGQRFVVVVPGDSLSGVGGSLDLTTVGGEAEALTFALIDGRWQSTALTLPGGSGFGSATLALTLTATEGGQVQQESLQVETSAVPLLDSSVLCETFPAALRGGTPFSLLVAGSELVGGTASVDFAPFADVAVTSPLDLSEGRGSVSFATPADAAGADQRKLSLRLSFEDIAGNLITSFKQVSILPTGAEGDDSVVLRSFSVDPSPVQPGQAYTVTAITGNATRGVALIDFRPHVPQIFRLPLSFDDGVATASGTAPTNLPTDINDFLTARVLLQSDDGSRQDEIEGIFPLVSLPPAPDLGLTVTSPDDGLLTRESSATVSGTVGADITSVSINRTQAMVSGGQFSALVPLREGVNELLIVGLDDAGNEARTIFRIERDSTNPLVNIEVPSDGAILTMRETTVAGFVNDLAETTITSALVGVTVNGVAARVTNRSYELQNFPIVPGENIITVVATDRAGNVATSTHEISFVETSSQQTIRIASGNNQFGRIGGIVGDPLVVEVIDAQERPQGNVPVTFEVIRGDGSLTFAEETERRLTFMTDDAGRAEVFFRLGSRSGEGNNRVSAKSPGFLGEVTFCATAVGSIATQVAALEPVFQTGQPGGELAQPLQVYVTDEGGNPLGDVPVRFNVLLGGGTIYGQSEVIVDSGESGRISVPLLLAESFSDPRYLVVATIAGSDEGSAAVFEGLIQLPAAEEDTRVVGVVLDSANRPMPSVTVHIKGEEARVLTDDEGQFSLSNVPVGDVTLEIDGTTTTLPGVWPHMEYELFAIAGQANRVDRPIFLLPLDEESTKLVGGDEDVVLQLEGVPGATLTVKAGSVIGVNGESEVPLRWTQVNRERVPMAPPLGAQFSYVTTVQPPNVRFDPPAIMQFPNSGGEPGQQVEMFSFDHDIGDYVSLGTATVSEDAAVVRSDSGFGLRKSGWSGFVPPPPPCKPAETMKPPDTACETWFERPRTNKCQAKRYFVKQAKVLTLDLKVGMGGVDGLRSSEIEVFTDEDVTFVAQATVENCRGGIAYQWQFPAAAVNGDFSEESAAAVRSFKEAGTYTITGAAQCRFCPHTRVEKTVTVKVLSGDKIITMTDSNGRVASGNKLEIVPPAFPGEVIKLNARYRDGKEPPQPPLWTISGPGTSLTERGKNISFNAGFRGTPPTTVLDIVASNPFTSTYTITCEDGETQTLIAYPSAQVAFEVTTDLAATYTERVNETLKNRFQTTAISFQGPTGKVSLSFAFMECPTSSSVGLGITASGGFDPLVGITGEIEIPLQRFLSVGGPFGFGASVAISFMETYLGFDIGMFFVPSGSVSLSGELTLDGCGKKSGDNFKLGGKIGLEIKLAAKKEGLGEIKVFGATGVSAGANLDVVNKDGMGVKAMTFDFDGIDVGIAISGEVNGVGESMDDPGRAVGVGGLQKWTPIDKISNFAGPYGFLIPYH